MSINIAQNQQISTPKHSTQVHLGDDINLDKGQPSHPVIGTKQGEKFQPSMDEICRPLGTIEENNRAHAFSNMLKWL